MIRLRCLAAGALLLTAASASAQALESFGLGATVGLSNAVDRSFHLEEFKTRDRNLWVEYRAEENVLLRGTFGSMTVKGANAGQAASVGGSPITLPDLRDKIDYATVGASYVFPERGWDTGLFAGIGGYKVNPDPVVPEIRNFRDRNETVWGFHVGVDADVQIWKRLSGVGRITFHRLQAHPHRSILTADLGLVYRF